MTKNPTQAALLMIDMEQAFVHPEGGLCIRHAAETVPACIQAADTAREKGIPVFFVKRIYRLDSSDVELSRYEVWRDHGKPCAPASDGENSARAPAGLRPKPGDYTIIKPRWSAFFQTELDLILRRLGIRTVILAGTTTPNCIRTTCYDAMALDYQTVVLTDCCSSRTEEVQRANLSDMEYAGALLMTSEEFAGFDENTVSDLQTKIRMEMCGQVPEPFDDWPDGWPDRW